MRSFREVLHPNIGDRVKMNPAQPEFITLVYVYKERKDMRKRLFAGLLASAVLGAAHTIPAQAGCVDNNTCTTSSRAVSKQSLRKTSAETRPAITGKKKASVKSKKRVRATIGSVKAPVKSTAKKSRKKVSASSARGGGGGGGNVAAMIRSMAPSYGVPTWFALKIAQVESNYNPSVRGAAGEYGVYQLKCATAKGIGFSGNCSALLNPRVNVQYGLKHLSLAMKSSRGNLRLAASKHNGGLGRKTMVHGYVAKVF